MGRFYDPRQGRCVRARPELCDPGHSDGLSEQSAKLEKLREMQRGDKLEIRDNGARVVCYVTSWSMYRKGEGKFVPEHLDSRLCTDVVYAFASLNPQTLAIQSFDPWADIDNSLFSHFFQFYVLSKHSSQLRKVIRLDYSEIEPIEISNLFYCKNCFTLAAILFLKQHN